jgi:hypothetical protein
MIVSRSLPTQTSYSRPSTFVSKITYSRCHQLSLRKYLGPIWHKICSYTVFPQFRQADVRISWWHSQNHRIDVQCNQRVCARDKYLSLVLWQFDREQKGCRNISLYYCDSRRMQLTLWLSSCHLLSIIGENDVIAWSSPRWQKDIPAYTLCK